MRHCLLFLGGETGAERALVRARAHPISLSFPSTPCHLAAAAADTIVADKCCGVFFFPQSFFFFYMLIGGEAAVSRSPWCEIIHRSMGGFHAKARLGEIEAGDRPAERPSLGWRGQCRNTSRKSLR